MRIITTAAFPFFSLSLRRIGLPFFRRNQAIKKAAVLLFLSLTCRGTGAPVPIEYFFQAGCEECSKVNAFILPRLEEQYAGKYELMRYDIGVPENYLKLVAYQERLHIEDNAPVCMIVNHTRYLGGYRTIEQNLFSELAAAKTVSRAPAKAASSDLLRKRAEAFTIGAIVAAGLIDGINPCVFATLVFFLSLLAVSGIKGRKLLLVGGTYCLACFLSYLALGFGLFQILKLFSGYQLLQSGLEIFMISLLLVFAFLSFRDARRFRRNGKAEQVTLQLPDKVKRKIHSVMRYGLQYRFLIPGAFVIGVLVTGLESICTGQVYVPTLVLMAKEAGPGSQWFGELLLYNFMFILPLLFLFAAAYRGVSTSIFLRWSKQNVFLGKLALGSFFLLLAGLMLALNAGDIR